MPNIITISGLPGSGTSTAVQLLSEKLKWKHVDAGTMFRAMAREQGMDVLVFREFVADHPDVDEGLDEKMLNLARTATEPLILEARLIGWMTKKENIPAFRVWVDAAPEIRYARIARRESLGVQDATERSTRREKAEAEAFQRLYGIDLHDVSIYDMVIRNDNLKPNEVRDQIAESFEQYVRKH